MAKLFSVTVTKFNGDVLPIGNPTLLQPKKIISIQDAPASTTGGNIVAEIVYGRLENSNPDVLRANVPVSGPLTAMNAANTTDVHEIAVTLIDPETAATSTKNINVEDIHKVQIDPANSAKSYIWLENATKTVEQCLHVATAQADILAAANA